MALTLRLEKSKTKEKINMQSNLICPFFNTTKDKCEIGNDFISIDDAKNIIDLCICNYKDCRRYKYLNKRPLYFFDFIKDYLPKKIQMGGRNE